MAQGLPLIRTSFLPVNILPNGIATVSPTLAHGIPSTNTFVLPVTTHLGPILPQPVVIEFIRAIGRILVYTRLISQ